MWTPDEAKLLKVLLHSRGEDVETPWAEDCGPAPGEAGARYVRLGNVPFLHAKPTYGDVLVAVPDPSSDGYLAWDSGGLPFERIPERIAEDGGRWAMIIDYVPLDPASDVQHAFDALDIAAEAENIAVEGCYSPNERRPGRAYLAVPAELGVDDVLRMLSAWKLPMTFTLIHPTEDEPAEQGSDRD